MKNTFILRKIHFCFFKYSNVWNFPSSSPKRFQVENEIIMILWNSSHKFANYNRINYKLPIKPVLIRNLFFGSNAFDPDANANVLIATMEYTLSTKRFDEPICQRKQKI